MKLNSCKNFLNTANLKPKDFENHVKTYRRALIQTPAGKISFQNKNIPIREYQTGNSAAGISPGVFPPVPGFCFNR